MNDADMVKNPMAEDDCENFRTIELLFFAYRSFVGDADEVLSKYGFGRAHHRVLHFVNRTPGLTVAELLDILKITKQSLSRVLRELMESGHIAQERGSTDGRQRLLYPTGKGRKLALTLSQMQSRRINAAFELQDNDIRQGVEEFLRMMIDQEDRRFADRLENAAGVNEYKGKAVRETVRLKAND